MLDTSAIQESPAQLAARIEQQFRLGSLPSDFRREVLEGLVGITWGPLPPYSTLSRPEISEVAKATVGTGIVPIFKHPESGEWHAVVVRPGTHYQGSRYAADPSHPYTMIAGGFINLTYALSPAAEKLSRAEHPQEGAVRELREEIKDSQGASLLEVSPDRLRPVDTLTLSFKSGEKRVVIGYLLELSDEETTRILAHTKKTQEDPSYRRACRGHTLNAESGKPEVCQVDVLPLAKLIDEATTLLHPDQRSLFNKLHALLMRTVQ